MKHTILTVGKKHESWVEPGILRFCERLRAPFAVEVVILPNSSKERAGAIQDESEAILRRLKPDDVVILLDERGKNMSSPELSELILAHTDRHIVLIIGGVYGVNEEVRRRADVLWSLSRLVFPHQLVRLMVSEQLYRAQEIARGGKYHHE